MLLPECGPRRVTPAQAHRAVEDGSALLADVREEDEFQAGHAPAGHRSQQAARRLAGRGVTAVDVTGGMRAWAAVGLPVQDAHGAAGTVI